MAESTFAAPPRHDSRPPVDKPVAVVDPLVSIIIPCCGMVEYTMMCFPSILKHTRMPYELIFIDIGSLDGTHHYLAGIAHSLPRLRVHIVRTETDLGIANACKDALSRARGEFIVLLNNDTIVTPGWLSSLINLVTLQPQIGLAGPMSNYAYPPQLVETVPYRVGPRKNARPGAGDALVDVDAVETFAKEFRDKNKSRWDPVDRLGGFCLIVKREVAKRLDNQGQLSQSTDLGLFDTDILGIKAQEAGYKLALCRDLFIHHFGTRTFAHGAPQMRDRIG